MYCMKFVLFVLKSQGILNIAILFRSQNILVIDLKLNDILLKSVSMYFICIFMVPFRRYLLILLLPTAIRIFLRIWRALRTFLLFNIILFRFYCIFIHVSYLIMNIQCQDTINKRLGSKKWSTRQIK